MINNWVCRKMLVNIAGFIPVPSDSTSLNADKAFLLLEGAYQNDFYHKYLAATQAGEKVSVFDAAVDTVCESLKEDFPSLRKLLEGKRNEIIHRYLTEETSELLSKVVARPCITHALTRAINNANKYKRSTGRFETTRTEAVVADFVRVFGQQYDSGYQCYRFTNFVMMVFKNMYFNGKRKDIFRSIREPDLARPNNAAKMVREREVVIQEVEDLLIHDHLVNIREANYTLFRRTGTGDGSDAGSEDGGIQYDLYYCLLCQLCKERVGKINKQMLAEYEDFYGVSKRSASSRRSIAAKGEDKSDDFLKFVDLKDNSRDYPGIPKNDTVRGKITNGTSVVLCIFDYIRQGKLNVQNMADLRNKCFRLGMTINAENVRVWKAAVSSFGLHDVDPIGGRTNHLQFDIILRGVISAYTLITEFHRRGFDLVESYNPALFIDSSIIRYLDYLSSVQHIDLIKKLQRESDAVTGAPSLYDFEQMLINYGSSGNRDVTHLHKIKSDAVVRGFMKGSRIQKSDRPATKYDALLVVSGIFTAIPRSWKETSAYSAARPDRAMLLTANTHLRNCGAYNSLDNNVIVRRPNADLTSDYVRPKVDNAGTASEPIDLSWHVGQDPVYQQGIQYSGIVVDETGAQRMAYDIAMHTIYSPIEGRYIGWKKGVRNDGVVDNQPYTYSATVGNTFSDGFILSRGLSRFNPNLMWWYGPVDKALPLAQYLDVGPTSVGFNTDFGFKSEALTTDVRNYIRSVSVGSRKLYAAYFTSVGDFVSAIGEVADLQNDYREAFNQMLLLSASLKLGVCSLPAPDGRPNIPENEQVELGNKISKMLTLSKFDKDILEWMLRRMLDTSSCLDYRLVGNYNADPTEKCSGVRGNASLSAMARFVDRGERVKAVLSDSFYNAVDEQEMSLAEVFIRGYNYTNVMTDYIILLRDACGLLVPANMPNIEVCDDAPSLVCDLDARFCIKDTVTGFTNPKLNPINGAFVGKAAAYRDGIKRMRESAVARFSWLSKMIVDYINASSETIARLASFRIVMEEHSSEFENIGKSLLFMRRWEVVSKDDVATANFTNIRSKTYPDMNGYLRREGELLRVVVDSKGYYLHTTGRIVAEDPGAPTPYYLVEFSPTSQEDRALYRGLLGLFANTCDLVSVSELDGDVANGN